MTQRLIWNILVLEIHLQFHLSETGTETTTKTNTTTKIATHTHINTHTHTQTQRQTSKKPFAPDNWSWKARSTAVSRSLNCFFSGVRGAMHGTVVNRHRTFVLLLVPFLACIILSFWRKEKCRLTHVRTLTKPRTHTDTLTYTYSLANTTANVHVNHRNFFWRHLRVSLS